jgi:superfamily I DNA and RNA helicase
MEQKDLEVQQELIKAANAIERERVAKEIEVMKANMEKNQALIDALNARNEKLENEVTAIHAHTKLIEEMKP